MKRVYLVLGQINELDGSWQWPVVVSSTLSAARKLAARAKQEVESWEVERIRFYQTLPSNMAATTATRKVLKHSKKWLHVDTTLYPDASNKYVEYVVERIPYHDACDGC